MVHSSLASLPFLSFCPLYKILAATVHASLTSLPPRLLPSPSLSLSWPAGAGGRFITFWREARHNHTTISLAEY